MTRGTGRPDFWDYDVVNAEFHDLLDKLVRRVAASGHWDFEDTEHTSFETAQVYDNETAVLDNNAGVILKTQKPDHIDLDRFYNPTTSTFKFPQDGDSFIMTVDLDLRDASAAPEYLEMFLDDGSTERFGYTYGFVRGQGEDDHINHVFALRMKPGDAAKTWQLKIRTPDQIRVWNVAYEFQVLHRAW